MVRRFQSASAEILTAQGLLLEAFGYKKEAAKLKEQATAMGSGYVMDKESLEAAKAASEQASKRIEAKLNEGARLTKEGRMLYAKSLVPYTKGLLETKELAPDGKKFLESAKSQISNASWTEKSKVKNKLDTGMYVARKTPSYLTTLTSTSKKLLTYAKSQKVRVPKDATDALASL